MAEPQYDEFGNILNLDTSLDDPTTYNIYENRAYNTGQGANLQNVYGIRGGMPMFQFIRQIKTGERTYDPQKPEDRRYREEYDRYQQENPQAPTFADVLGETAIGFAPSVGSAVGEALVNPGGYYQGDALSRAGQGAMDTIGSSPRQLVNQTYENFDPSLYVNKGGVPFSTTGGNKAFIGELANADVANQTGNTQLLADLKDAREPYTLTEKGIFGKTTDTVNVYDTNKLTDSGFQLNPEGELYKFDKSVDANIAKEFGDGADFSTIGGEQVTTSSALTGPPPPSGGFSGYTSGVGDQFSFGSQAGQANYAAAGGAGIFAAATTLVLTGDVEKAAKTGAGTAIGQAIGTAVTLGNPIGTFIGGMIGGALGGRVICNELCNQGIIDRKMLINDYKFTRDYLTPSHVKGYHLWAIWMVKQMRKGRFVDLWSHIVIHRGNEIAYIYGERKKPDYLGKLYRKIFEPVCWILGAFSKQTDWSILYQKKEI
mgnify:FL=1|tara:strand:- start:1606 stop:3060 length:1455 start_codon:yes stop_codon:yes gene_type:complete